MGYNLTFPIPCCPVFNESLFCFNWLPPRSLLQTLVLKLTHFIFFYSSFPLCQCQFLLLYSSVALLCRTYHSYCFVFELLFLINFLGSYLTYHKTFPFKYTAQYVLTNVCKHVKNISITPKLPHAPLQSILPSTAVLCHTLINLYLHH